MRLAFAQPAVLLALLALLPAALLLARGSVAGLGRTRRALSTVARSLVFVLLALALAGTRLERDESRLALLLLVDRSESVLGAPDSQVTEPVERLLASAPAGTQVGVILFGRHPVLAVPPRRDLTPAMVREALRRPVDGGETDLEAALRLALLAFPPRVARRAALFTDGNETAGDCLSLAARLGREGVRVALYPLHRPPGRVAAVEGLVLSTRRAFLGESVEIGVPIRASHPMRGELQIEVTHSRPESLRRRVSLEPGRNGPFTFTLVPSQKGPHHLKAIFTPDPLPSPPGRAHDAPPRPAARAAFLDVLGGSPRVLLVEGVPGKERYLSGALAGERIEVEARPPAGIPTALVDLVRYDCLILSDVPASAMSREQMELVRHWVTERGGAFVMVGGTESFGQGGWYKTPIEEILPVQIEIPQRLEIPSLAIVMAIDKSGSMSGKKLDLAKEAAVAVVELLSRKDWVGVVAFDSAAEWTVPLQQVVSRTTIAEAIGKVESGGGTFFQPALQEAYEGLLRTQARLKHVILLSDGHTNSADYQTLVTRMVLDRITVSTVAIGDAADTDLMKKIAEWGQGRHYFTRDEFSVPQIFTQETIKASKSALKEIPFRPAVHHPHQSVRGIDFAGGPYLQGYVVTRARPTAEVPLAWRGDPILAVWHVGLGKVAAFTSDAKDRWAAMWLEWSGFPKLWGQLVRELIAKRARQPGLGQSARAVSGQVEVRPLPGGESVEIALDLVDSRGEFANRFSPRARLVYQGESEGARAEAAGEVTLAQDAPGRYRATTRLARPGTYLVQVTAEGTDLLESVDFQAAPSGEALSGVAVNRKLLETIARWTGGEVSPDPRRVLAWSAPPQPVSRDLWPLLVLLALLLLPVDVAIRRLGR